MSEKTYALDMWVIRSEKRKPSIFGDSYFYLAERTADKNPRFATQIGYNIKFFTTKAEAEAKYYARVSKGNSMQGFRVMRKRVFVDKDGTWSFYKNRGRFR